MCVSCSFLLLLFPFLYFSRVFPCPSFFASFLVLIFLSLLLFLSFVFASPSSSLVVSLLLFLLFFSLVVLVPCLSWLSPRLPGSRFLPASRLLLPPLCAFPSLVPYLLTNGLIVGFLTHRLCYSCFGLYCSLPLYHRRIVYLFIASTLLVIARLLSAVVYSFSGQFSLSVFVGDSFSFVSHVC